MNLPNKITVSRFFLSLVYFVFMYFAMAGGRINLRLIDVSLALFIIAALTDVVDGYLARRYGMVTHFGRIADPFVDKVLICGSFIFLVSWPVLNPFLQGWMVVVIVTREFLVHGIRGMLEANGVAFPSTIWGKQKTLIQCLTVIFILLYIGHLQPPFGPTGLSEEAHHNIGYLQYQAISDTILKSFIWLTVISTVFSGLTYFYNARKALRAIL